MTTETASGAETAPAGQPDAVLPRPMAPGAQRAAWSSHLKAGREHFLFRRYPQAETEFVIAMRLARGFGPATQRELTSLVNLERVAEKYPANSADLIRITRVILPIAVDLRGATHRSVGRHSAALGTALVATGDFEAARAPLKNALAIVLALEGENSLEVASLHAQLAAAEEGVGDLAAAETEILLAIDTAQRVLGEDDPVLAPYFGALAQFLAEAGRTPEAETAYLRASRLATSQSALAEAVALNELAGFYTKLGRAIEAEPLALRALALIETENEKRQIPPALTAACLDTLGVALLSQEKYAEAETHLARAYQLGPEVSGSPFDEVRQHYAQLLRATDREAEATAVEIGGALAAAPSPQPTASEASMAELTRSEPTVSEPAAMPTPAPPAESNGSAASEALPASDAGVGDGDGEDTAD